MGGFHSITIDFLNRAMIRHLLPFLLLCHFNIILNRYHLKVQIRDIAIVESQRHEHPENNKGFGQKKVFIERINRKNAKVIQAKQARERENRNQVHDRYCKGEAGLGLVQQKGEPLGDQVLYQAQTGKDEVKRGEQEDEYRDDDHVAHEKEDHRDHHSYYGEYQFDGVENPEK